jgi:hypothetical protein
VYISGFGLGSGSYTQAKIGNTQANAYSATPVNISGLANYQWSGLAQGTWYVVLYDSTGGSTIKSTSFVCPTPTPTATPTSTPTATPTSSGYAYSISVARGTTGPTGSACTLAAGGSYFASVYNNTYTFLVDGETYYNANGTLFITSGYFSDGSSYGRFISGVFTKDGNCTV